MVYIRRYYGYDADTVNGFNNGRYIDDEYIEVKDLGEAFKKCEEFLRSQYTIPDSTTDLQDLDNGVEFTLQKLDGTEDDYRYVFVTFEERL